MPPRTAITLRRIALVACAGAALPDSAVAQGSALGSLLRLESGTGRLDEVAEITRNAEISGEWKRGMTDLATIARTAKEAGERMTWIAAELAWVRLATHDGEETDLDDALQELASRARDWGLSRQEAEVYTFWAEHLEDSGEWLMALRALDRAAQASLGSNQVNSALAALADMSRLCRENDHPWRLQEVWLRIAQVEAELAYDIDTATRELLDDERAEAAPMLETVVPLETGSSRVDLQPTQAAVRVSAPHSEVGRARFFLTNESVHTVSGTLKVSGRTGVVKKWESGDSGHWLTLTNPATKKTAAQTVPASRTLSLRPGERLSVYVEREQPDTSDTVNLTWSGPGGEALATGDFTFAAKEPRTSLTTAGSMTMRPGWNAPFYHEINHRGPQVKVEDLQFQTSVPCRLEIFDVDGGNHPSVDAGKLLAVDADGDGFFTSEDDRVASDFNDDGQPDVLIGDRSRSLEIFAWPLVPLLPGEEVTLYSRLRRPNEPAAWRTDSESRLSVPQPPALEAKKSAKP